MKIKNLYILILLMGSVTPTLWAGPAAVEHIKGHPERKFPQSADWGPLDVGDRLPEGSAVRTDDTSDVDLVTDQGHKLHLGPSSTISLSSLQPDKTKTFLSQGKVLSKVVPLKGQEKFLIQTPSAVCAVRGTEFWTGANPQGTAVEVRKGVVGMMAPGTHTELLVHPGETASILKNGSVIPPHTAQAKGVESPLAHAARHEVGLDMTREQVMAAAAAEIRLAEYREGKSLVDVHGNRVRLEEYIVRPQPNQFKLVALDQRGKEQLDYFFFIGTFNQALPTDLSLALKDMNGKLGATAPDYYLTSYERGQSNTQDSVHDSATGGHLVNVTIDSNGDYVLTDASDPTNTRTVSASQLELNGTTYKVYNPISDTFLTGVTADQLADQTKFSMYTADRQTFQDLAPGDTFWQTRFNTYSHMINTATKISYAQSGAANVLASNLDASWTYAGGFVFPVVETDPNNVEATITNYYGDGTFEKYHTWLIDDNGHIAPLSAFSGIPAEGGAYKNELLKWNYEQETTATEFQGRKIDLVVEPKIFIESGLIQ
jgi:hypothetical protein